MYSFIILPFFNLYLIFSSFLFLNGYIFKINLIWNNFKFKVAKTKERFSITLHPASPNINILCSPGTFIKRKK